MLTELIVEDLGVIDRAEITFTPGSNVLTGETGAGKTLVVAAVGLLLGDRAEKVLVRQGSRRASVQGRFVVPKTHGVVTALVARGLLDSEDEEDAVEVILARTVPVGSSATARINGRLVPASVLAEIGPRLVEIAGQHEHGRISRSSSQRRILDEFGGPEIVALATRVAADWRKAMDAQRRLDELTTTERARERELDMVRFEISEIEGAGLDSEEDERLTTEARRLEQAESIELSLNGALDALKGEDGVIDRLARASNGVDPVASIDPEVEQLRARMDQLQVEADDVAAELSRRLITADPAALEKVRDRLGVLARLKRKYGDTIEEVLAYLGRARDRRDELESAGQNTERLAREVDEARSRARTAAEELSARRAKNAELLQAEVTDLLHDLALPDASFEIALTKCDLYEGGAETVEFRVAANPGETPRPLAKVASGGELSRIALALHLLTSSSAAPTMIFEEVDAGVGGAAAQSVGRALAQLGGSGRQVIIVTHLPQVAAFCDAHFRIEKGALSDRARASIQRVRDEERIAELSRMLAGLPASERAQQHAQELLDLAAGSGTGR